MKLKYRVIERFRGKYSVEAMCEVFEVSRSGYYAWRKRQERAAKDQWLADLILECQKKCKQTYGIRRVRRWIQRQTGKEVNLKAILRLMRKLNLLSVVRRRRPYTRYQQAVHKSLRSGAAQSVLGYGYYLHPDSGRYAVYVCCARFVREGRAELEDRLRNVFLSGH